MDNLAGDAQSSVWVCFYCARLLEPIYDYSCVDCGRLTCDNDCEVCDEDNCGLITCIRCMESHMRNEHPLSPADLASDSAVCG